MGSWSVCCGISKIAITSGNPCVLIPLKQGDLSYQEYQPATLPIFGTYNDYGGMEDIEVNENTKFIEEYFGVTIDEFVEFLVDGKHTYNRGEASEILKKFNTVPDNLESMRFMWVDRQVYDFMTIYNDDWYKGYHDYGTPVFMELFGFTKDEDHVPAEGDNYDPKRFKHVYRKGDVMMYSDGKTLLSPKARNGYVYHFGHGNESSIETYFDVPEELNYLKDLGKHQTWKLMPHNWFRKEYGFMLAKRYDFDFMFEGDDEISKLMNKRSLNKLKSIGAKYYLDLDKFGDDIANLYTFFGNFHPMSAEFRPHVLYMTPQCGEHNQHQRLLEKFCEINKSYCYEEE